MASTRIAAVNSGYVSQGAGHDHDGGQIVAEINL
jgi:hypothetical protein